MPLPWLAWRSDGQGVLKYPEEDTEDCSSLMTHSDDEYDIEDGEPEDGKPEDAEPEDVEPEDAEPEDMESEDTEPEDTEPEDVEPEDAETEECDKLPDPSPMLAQVRQNTAKPHSQISIKYSKTRDIAHFEVGELASLYIPRIDRHGTSARQLFCKIIQKPHPDRYQLQTIHGIINRY